MMLRREDAKGEPEALSGAYAFVDMMVDRRDDYANGGFLWHGWALRDAFLAGIEWERQRVREESRGEAFFNDRD